MAVHALWRCACVGRCHLTSAPPTPHAVHPPTPLPPNPSGERSSTTCEPRWMCSARMAPSPCGARSHTLPPPTCARAGAARALGPPARSLARRPHSRALPCPPRPPSALPGSKTQTTWARRRWITLRSRLPPAPAPAAPTGSESSGRRSRAPWRVRRLSRVPCQLPSLPSPLSPPPHPTLSSPPPQVPFQTGRGDAQHGCAGR